MKHQYDWSKLDTRWQFDGVNTLIDRKWEALYPIEALENGDPIRGKLGCNVPAAQDQLAKCRVEPAPEPSPEYNWNKLEGTGWRVGNGAYITNGKFNYWYTLGDRPKLEALFKFDASEALAAENAAFEAVEKCRRDWRQEVREACVGIDGLGELYQLHDWQLRMRAAENPCLFGMMFTKDRTFQLVDGVRTLEWVLKLSLVIERLKKLGWRES